MVAQVIELGWILKQTTVDKNSPRRYSTRVHKHNDQCAQIHNVLHYVRASDSVEMR